MLSSLAEDLGRGCCELAPKTDTSRREIMLLDRSLHQHILQHSLNVIRSTNAEVTPFPHLQLTGIFPDDVFYRLITSFPTARDFAGANQKDHRNSDGRSSLQRMNLCENSLSKLSDSDHRFWSTLRAAISSIPFKEAIFSKFAPSLSRRFKLEPDKATQIPAYARSQLQSESQGFRMAPQWDTGEKIVTMQFALPHNDSLEESGTEFYQLSLNPLHYLREPRGFVITKSMPFLPNRAYALSVSDGRGSKSWHGRRSSIYPSGKVRNTLTQIWYTDPDETERELEAHRRYFQTPESRRRIA